MLFVSGFPPCWKAYKLTYSHTDTHIWDALVKLAGLQLQNHNSVVGYYEWEWAGFSLRGEKHIQPDLLPYTHSVSTLHTHTHEHWKAWRWYQLGRKSLKCPSQALWSALAVITWWWMGGWSNEIEKKKETLFSPINSTIAFSLSTPSVCRSLYVFVTLSVCVSLSGVREREDEKGGRGGGRGLWSSVHTSLKTTSADID